ncbi:hypothetical protein [Tamlana sp. I1]|uniref:hypothetical protein n=1 Tax=Tamlana sp. I1 TaxID=2762061 RepID=UPI00188EA8F7|nr:hypothetical protein [Tamlana sp. I1]
MNFVCQRERDSGEWNGISTGAIYLKKYLTNEIEQIVKSIDSILNNPTISSQNDDFIKSLIEIRESWFFTVINTFKDLNNNSTGIQFHNDAEYLLYKEYLSVRKYSDKRGFTLK